MTYAALPDRPGVAVVPLFQSSWEQVDLERWQPQTSVECELPGGAELLVLSGELTEGGVSFARLSWLRLPAGTQLRAHTGASGCTFWIKRGHLAHVNEFAGVFRDWGARPRS
jgi:hypothetical protein